MRIQIIPKMRIAIKNARFKYCALSSNKVLCIIVGAVSVNFGRFWDMADKSTKIGRNTL